MKITEYSTFLEIVCEQEDKVLARLDDEGNIVQYYGKKLYPVKTFDTTKLIEAVEPIEEDVEG